MLTRVLCYHHTLSGMSIAQVRNDNFIISYTKTRTQANYDIRRPADQTKITLPSLTWLIVSTGIEKTRPTKTIADHCRTMQDHAGHSRPVRRLNKNPSNSTSFYTHPNNRNITQPVKRYYPSRLIWLTMKIRRVIILVAG